MKKFCIRLLILGILLLAAGIGYRLYTEGTDMFRLLNNFIDHKLTPQLAHQLLNEGISVFGKHYTLETLTKAIGSTDINQFILSLRLYGMTTYVTIAGAVCSGVGVLGSLLFKGKRK